MAIKSLDLTVAVIRLPERLIFIASVSIEGRDSLALYNAYSYLRKAIAIVQQDIGAVVNIMIIGDFNRYNQL